MHHVQYALQSKLIGRPLKTGAPNLNIEQLEKEGYEKRGKNLVNGDRKGTSWQKIDMGREKERFL